MPFESSSRIPRAYHTKHSVVSGSREDWKAEEAARAQEKDLLLLPVKLVEEELGFDNLDSTEEGKYLHNLKTSHGLEP